MHEIQEVGLDVRAHDAVGFDDGAGFGVDVVPRAAELGAQPSAQWAKQVGERLAPRVRAAHALAAGQQVRVKVRRAQRFAGTGIPAGSFNDDLVHVRAHLRG